MGETWFVTRELGRETYFIGEPPHVNSFLVLGQRRAILFDTGLGIANIRSVVESLSDLAVLVVNSHYHFDHSGGNHLYEEVAIHRNGVDPLAAGPAQEWLDRYAEYAAEMLERFNLYKELDDRFFRLLTAETTPRPLPRELRGRPWSHTASVPTRLLDDGDLLDLGGRRLRVIHTPGHTPDSICLLDENRGALFAGDTLSTGPLYAHLPDSDVNEFARSIWRLEREVAHGVEVVYPSHMLRFATDRAFIEEVADGFKVIMSGGAQPRDSVDVFGDPVREFWFDRFSIVVPPRWHPKEE